MLNYFLYFHSIDANGVIVRVVHLFKGHRNLILGFNAFLPKTHHIDPNIQDFSRWAQNLPGASSHTEVSSGSYAASAGPSNGSNSMSTIQQPQYSRPSGYAAVQPSPYTSNPQISIQSTNTPAAAGISGIPTIPAVGPSASVVRGSNVQFSRAVSFVEKIKTRFTNQPETYRSFLSLLHSFHRDQRGIKEVYLQVQQLFRNEPDLLEEFSLFLPDNNVSASNASGASRSIPSSMLPPVGRFPSASPSIGAPVSAVRQGVPVQTQKRTTAGVQSPQFIEKPKRSRPHETYSVTKTTDETEFFEKVKKYLGSRQVYADFLKCLSLFSQDVLKLPDLINMVQGFIGGNDDLFSWFKRYINLKDSDLKLLDSSSVSRSNGEGNAGSFAEAQVPELNFSALKRVGCYRIYPRGYRLCKASGRTVLCDEVLNDELVSCAVFESEDSGFVSSKKNQYEDALFKCEDERFEMDLILEYNLSTIAVLDPISKRIERMTSEERESFRLDHRLNGTSEVIYKKAIKRIYGDKSDDIYEYLQRNPCASVPVVLKRLKAKDEEWRRVQRDWNRVWAEIHIKNYYKALDHQGIDFKASDRKTLTTRSLVNEIQVIKEERKRVLERTSVSVNNNKTPPRMISSAPHMSQMMSDSKLLKDLLHLIEVTIRSSASFSGVDRKSLIRFFSTFVPEFFRIETLSNDDSDVSDNVSPIEKIIKNKDEEESDDGNEKASKMMTDDSSVDSSTSSSSSSSSSKDNENENDKNKNKMRKNRSQNKGNLLLYANDALFSFVRIFMISYERLEKLKQSAQLSQNRPFFTEKTNVVAQFLDLHSRQSTMTVDEELATGRDFYGVLLYLLEQLIEGEIEAGLFEEKVRYMFGTSGYLIFTFDKVILSLLRQTLVVLNDAVCENLIRLYDSWRSLKGPRNSEYSARLAAETIVNESSIAATAVVNPNSGNSFTGPTSNLYRIELNLMKKQLTIHLVDKLSLSLASAVGGGGGGINSNSNGTIEEKWSTYVDNFVKLESNSLYLSPQSRPFLLRTRRSSDFPLKNISILYNLECKICINTYKIFYVENTEDLLIKRVRVRLSTQHKRREREALEGALKIKL